jgi:hypothetical protein
MKNLLYRVPELKKTTTADDYKIPPTKVKEIEREADDLLS